MYKCSICGADFPSQEEVASHMMRHIGEQLEKQHQAVAQTYLLMTAAQLTQICLISGRKPDEAMELFTRLFELLKNWHSNTQDKDRFMHWLDQQWEDKGAS